LESRIVNPQLLAAPWHTRGNIPRAANGLVRASAQARQFLQQPPVLEAVVLRLEQLGENGKRVKSFVDS
jgi:hypothetical protein